MEIGMSTGFPSNVGIVYLANDPMLTQLGLEFLVDTCKFRLFFFFFAKNCLHLGVKLKSEFELVM